MHGRCAAAAISYRSDIVERSRSDIVSNAEIVIFTTVIIAGNSVFATIAQVSFRIKAPRGIDGHVARGQRHKGIIMRIADAAVRAGHAYRKAAIKRDKRTVAGMLDPPCIERYVAALGDILTEIVKRVIVITFAIPTGEYIAASRGDLGIFERRACRDRLRGDRAAAAVEVKTYGRGAQRNFRLDAPLARITVVIIPIARPIRRRARHVAERYRTGIAIIEDIAAHTRHVRRKGHARERRSGKGIVLDRTHAGRHDDARRAVDAPESILADRADIARRGEAFKVICVALADEIERPAARRIGIETAVIRRSEVASALDFEPVDDVKLDYVADYRKRGRVIPHIAAYRHPVDTAEIIGAERTGISIAVRGLQDNAAAVVHEHIIAEIDIVRLLRHARGLRQSHRSREGGIVRHRSVSVRGLVKRGLIAAVVIGDIDDDFVEARRRIIALGDLLVFGERRVVKDEIDERGGVAAAVKAPSREDYSTNRAQ